MSKKEPLVSSDSFILGEIIGIRDRLDRLEKLKEQLEISSKWLQENVHKIDRLEKEIKFIQRVMLINIKECNILIPTAIWEHWKDLEKERG